MRYAIKFEANLRREINRYVDSQVDDLALELLRTRYDLDVGIHEARKVIKELRATLRLLKPLVGPAHAENWQLLRDVAAQTSALRDAHVGQQLWFTVAAELQPHPDLLVITRQLEKQKRSDLAAHPIDVDAVVESLQRLAAQLLQRKPVFLDGGIDVTVDQTWLIKRYRALYRRLEREFEQVAGSVVADSRHDLRKRGKDLLYALRLCRPVWNSSLKQFHRDLLVATDGLGDANDLAVLEARVLPLAETAPEPLQQFMEVRRRLLWEKADRRLQRLLQGGEERFLRRLERLFAAR